MQCDKCKSENIIAGKLTTGLGGVVFTTEESQPKMPFTKNYSKITALVCKSCGNIFNLRLENPENIDPTK